MSTIYAPSKTISSRLGRRLVRFEARRLLAVNLDCPVVSFSFDDCPKSVMDNALKPLEAEGWLATVYISMGLCGTSNHLGLHMNEADVTAVHASGHEIADHSYSHQDASAETLDFVLRDIEENQDRLSGIGVPPSRTFAYPYGQTTKALKRVLGSRFKGARGIHSASHTQTVDLNQIGSCPLYQGRDFDDLLRRIKALKKNPGWLTIFTHDVRETPSDFGCTPAQMRAVMEAVKDCGAQVLPIAEAIDHLERARG